MKKIPSNKYQIDENEIRADDSSSHYYMHKLSEAIF